MLNRGLPPPEATLRELLAVWTDCLSFRLFSNEPQMTEPRELSDYVEASFPGYSASPLPDITVVGDDAEIGAAQVELFARWKLGANIDPVIIRGWFLTALYADGFITLLAEHLADPGAIIQHRGDTVVAIARITHWQYDAP